MDAGTRANAIGLTTNLGLAVMKLAVGVFAGSAALLADGYNSAGDVVATGVAWFGYRFAQHPADANHPFGHGNAENVAGLIVGAMLFATGAYITVDGCVTLASGPRPAPELLAVYAAVATGVVKEGLYHYTTAVGNRVRSPALLASARDHRADVLVAAAVVGAVLGARAGLPILDPLTAIGVGAYVSWMAVEPIRNNLGVLMDEASPEESAELEAVASADPDVLAASVRMHPLGASVVVDLELQLEPSTSLAAASVVGDRVADAIRAHLDHVQEVRVRTIPFRDSEVRGSKQ